MNEGESKPRAPKGFSPRRLKALVKKEVLQVFRDPSSILIAFVLPLVLLFIFGYGVSLDAKDVPIGMVIEKPSPSANAFAGSFTGSPYFRVYTGTDVREFEDDLMRENIRGIIVIPADFEKRLENPHEGESPVQVITDGSLPQIASFVENYCTGALRQWRQLRLIESGQSPPPSLQLEPRFWFNPSAESRNFLLPGSLAIILTVVGALLTSLVVAREWERGTMESLLASPISRVELLLGKIIPYFVLGLFSFYFSVLTVVFVFHVPFRGSFGALTLVASTFLLSALGIGLTISSAMKNQFQACQAALNAAFLPAFLLSGFIFEIRSMPTWIQMITHLMPARYFVTCLQTLFQAGDVWPVLLPNIGMLLVMGALFIGLTAKNTPRTLD